MNMPDRQYVELAPRLFPGDVVTYGREATLYKVIRPKQVKVIVEDEAGTRWELRISGCKKVDDPSIFVSLKPEVQAPKLAFGMAVRFADPNRPDKFGVFVVIGQTAAGFKVSRLGGSEGMRYWHSLDAEKLVPVPEINNQTWV
jgi:hypothetical protein